MTFQGLKISDNIIVSQRKDWEEVKWFYEVENFYNVSDEKGKLILYVIETGGHETRRAWKSHPLRPFVFQIDDAETKEHLYTIKAPLRVFWFAIEVLKPDGSIVGSVERKLSWRGRYFKVNGVMRGFIKGFWLTWKYKLFLNTENQGEMKKRWNGFFKVLFSMSEFKISFKPTTTQENRLFLLSCAFLPEMLYHDRNQK